MNIRAVAAHVIERVMFDGESLTAVLANVSPSIPEAQDRGFLQALAFGVIRWYWELDFVLRQLAKRPIKERRIEVLALLGLYQLRRMRVKPHAAVSETVSAAGASAWAKPFLNALLRNYQRQQHEIDAALDQDEIARTSHPRWLIRQLRSDWPDDYQEILRANNDNPPMTLRVNRRKTSRVEYLDLLAQNGISARPGLFGAEAILLDEALAVQRLPGFDEGWVSVQDEAPQLAAGLLQTAAGQRVLDVCAAPGGKTLHLLENEPGLREVVALDIAEERADLIRSSLKRAGLQADVRVADATRPGEWWDGKPFERILLDAPCSATGVIRRHPDIKLLRKPADIAALGQRQRELLTAIWPVLRPGGLLLYATCSVFKAENENVIEAFLLQHSDAREDPISAPWGRPASHGRQILAGDHGMDGFFYARLAKAGS